jgi:DNA-binding transcriptional MerR regulator
VHMTATLIAIGDFSRMTYLSVKALRHYHDIGLLVPADVDEASGYRRYTTEQIAAAQVIRRLRELQMPLESIRQVITAPDPRSRNAVIAGHLRSMERQLESTQSLVASLRALLTEPERTEVQVEYRVQPAVRTIALRERIGMADAEAWWGDAFQRLRALLFRLGVRRAGPDGALYYGDFFQSEAGDVVAFIPIADTASAAPGASIVDIPAAEVAVTVHRGPFADLDRTYALLGTYVAERAIGIEGPIRENYLVSAADTPDEAQHRTEVCWPIFRTKGRS